MGQERLVPEGQGALVPEELPEGLAPLIGPYLARQRWYAGEGQPDDLRAVASGLLVAPGQDDEGTGRLWWAIVEAAGSRYQLLVAERPAAEGLDRAHGHEEAVLGVAGDLVYYDATVDSDLALTLLAAASEGRERAERARPLGVEQSNSSIVYDDRLILKVFRRLSLGGPNPDVEVTGALAATGFSHIAAPAVRWRRDGADLAFGQQYLAGGTDGWALALTSLRDLYGGGASEEHSTPALSGGDFAAEVSRLGQVTAEMHLAMAEAFGSSDHLARQWEEFVDALYHQVDEVVPELVLSGAPLFRRLHEVSNVGPSVRVHGDYHLGQVMRTDAGWFVLDFEGEPNRPLDERLRPTSVMKDVAGMLRSLQYAPQFALRERAGGEPSVLGALAEAWQERNCNAFLLGYYECKGIDELLPPVAEDREAVRLAFELDKAIYEMGYEKAYRPDWVAIPRAAVERLLTEPVDRLLVPPSTAEEDETDDTEQTRVERG